MTLMTRLLVFAALLAVVGCDRRAPPAPPAAPAAAQPSAPPSPANLPPVEPPAPGTPGGLPDDRTPVSEAPFAPDSAQGAANVVQTYYALLEERKYAEARALRADGGEASGADAFARGFDRYSEYHAQIGAPGEPEGAAGSIYVTVPVVIYGRLKTGAEVHEKGEATLRRVNNVPGSSAEQRKWHIERIETKAAG